MSSARWLVAAACAVLLLLVGGVGGGCRFLLDCRDLVGAGVSSDSHDIPPVIAASGPAYRGHFGEEVVLRGLVEPTDFGFLPNGGILVSEKRGLVRLASGGKLARRPVLDLRDDLSSSSTRGLVTIRVDPEFSKNGYFYVLRTLGAGADDTGPTTARLSRFVLDGTVARAASEVVLLGSEDGGQSCLELSARADCLPADFQHVGGQIDFADDGTLFVTTGDGGGGPGDFDPISSRAQDLDSLGGKVLRITRDGRGVSTNPHWSGDPDQNRSKVWARGVRNPFRFTIRPGPRELYVADLGEHGFDEISVATRGSNLGWPCYEASSRYEAYARTPMCASLYRAGRAAVRWPAVEFDQRQARSVTGGVFSTGSAYPRRFAGAYFFADFIYGWLKILRFTRDNRLVGTPEPFAVGLSGPVAIHQGPDGYLYYLSFFGGELRRIVPKR